MIEKEGYNIEIFEKMYANHAVFLSKLEDEGYDLQEVILTDSLFAANILRECVDLVFENSSVEEKKYGLKRFLDEVVFGEDNDETKL